MPASSISRLLALVALTAGVASGAAAAEPPAAADLLRRSIEYHDPDGRWGRAPLALVFEESRPDGSARQTEVIIDLEEEAFSWSSERQGREVAGRLRGADCSLTLDGAGEISAADAETHGLTCETLVRRRDYYTYLWGLPMKLRDPGTRIGDEVSVTELDGREMLSLEVTYDESVGKDTWYFYFDPATAALAGYRFYHDESANDGEYITLEGEARVGGMRLPRTRSWYYNKDDGYLGTDTLVGEGGTRYLRDGVLVSRRRPALAVDVADDFAYVGRHPFRIRDVAAGERFLFVDTEGEKVRRLFIVQLEAFLPGVDDHFRYDLSASPTVAGYPWRGNGFAFDLGDARASSPGGESAMTASFLEQRGYVPPAQWMMWRSLTVTDEERKSEAILFYVEDVADAGLTLDDLYRNGEVTPRWAELQAGLERRASDSFALTTIDSDGEPEVSGWARIPVRGAKSPPR